MQQRQHERQQGEDTGCSVDDGHRNADHQPGKDVPLGERVVGQGNAGMVIPVGETQTQDNQYRSKHTLCCEVSTKDYHEDDDDR